MYCLKIVALGNVWLLSQFILFIVAALVEVPKWKTHTPLNWDSVPNERKDNQWQEVWRPDERQRQTIEEVWRGRCYPERGDKENLIE